jgi:hypothetical protein
MKIVFLCGSLEPGRDGVGDFTRRLSGELIRQKHSVAAVALNDMYVVNEITSSQEVDGINLPVLRVPSVQPLKTRFERAKGWIKEFDPEWLSLQYVPFSFHSKGLPFGLSKLLSELGQGRRWHIMFHELWVGMNVESSKKYIWWGWLQKQLIKSLISGLKPNLIQTQTRLYQAQLSKLGFNSGFLPLFPNIPNFNKTKAIYVEKNTSFKDEISFVIFGAIHPGAPIEEFAKDISQYAKNNGRKISLSLIGRCGEEQKNWTTIFRSVGVDVKLVGEQIPERISELLGNASVGISTTPIALADKSSAIMVMREHGLTVVCVSMPWQPRGVLNLEPLPGIIEYRKGNLELCLSGKSDLSIVNSLPEVSNLFIDSISATV